MLVRDLRPQGREPWCTCSRGSAPLSRATSLEAARLYLKLSPTRVESLHVPTSRASRATRPSPRLSIRDGPAPRRLRWTAVHRGVRSVWPRSPAPLGRGACKQAGGLSCPRASTEFPDVASPGAPTLCPARRQPLPRRPRRPAAQGGPVGRLRGAAPRRRHAERWEVSPRQTCSVPPMAALCTISAAGTPPTVFGSRAPVRSRALAPSAGGSRRVPFSSVASLLAELGQRGGSRAGARGCRRVGSRP